MTILNQIGFEASLQDRVNNNLNSLLNNSNQINKSIAYALSNPGKRVRPILIYLVGDALKIPKNNLDSIAVASEIIHTYSLVHDDLPCMDDDDMRRGKPTNHKVFGEPVAVLAGDALLTLAFEIISSTKPNKKYNNGDMVKELALISGSKHLVGGQVLDLEGENEEINSRTLQFIHSSKTAALLTSSLKLGAMSVGASPVSYTHLRAHET